MALLITTIFYYIVGFILLACSAIYLFFRHSYSYWAKRKVPCLPTEFLFGSMADSFKMKITLGEQLMNWYHEYKAKGERLFGCYLFHQPILVLTDTQLVKHILMKDFNHFMDRGGYCNEEDDPLTAHLFSMSGLKWRHLRQRLTPTFTSGKLKKMFHTLVDCTEDLKDCLDESISKAEPIDIKNVLVKYTTDVIGSCAFGLDCNSFKNPDSDFIKIGAYVFHPKIIDRCKMFFAFVLPKVAKFFRMKVTNKEVDSFFCNLVKDTIEYRETNKVTRNDFMQLLIQLKNNERLEDEDGEESEETIGTSLTLNEATAQAFIFFVAGFETSSTTMCFCLLELAKHIDIQKKARDEIVKVLKKHDGKFSYEALTEMHYLERIIQETLRKHPPVMILQRVVTEEYTVPDTDLVLEKGLGVFIPMLGLQMDPEFYPEPEKFDPDRFTEENKASRPDCTYLPFGDGPRICIGLRFAMMQTKVGICRLLCSYKFTLNPKTCDPIVLDAENFVRSVKDDVWLNAEKITA